MILNSPTISGSLTVTGNTVLSGSINVVGGLTGTASFASTATSASYALSSTSSSYALASTSASYALSSTSSSYALTSTSASYGLNALTSSNSMTASSADTLYVRNNATVLGSITAQTLVVQTITSSVLITTGSNIIGSSLSNVQQITGSLYQTGSTAAFAGTVQVGTGFNLRLSADSSNGEIIGASGKGLRFYTNDGVSNPLNITGGGNVGIGTNSPSTYGFFVVNSTADSSGVSTVIRNQTDTGGDNTRYAGVDFMVGSDNSTAAIRAYRTNSASDYSNALTFWTKGSGAGATSPTERMRISATGNVGIGTSSPGYTLDISGSSTTALRVADTGDVGFQMMSGGSNNAFSIRTNGSTVIMSTSNSYPLSIGVNSSSGAVPGSTTGLTIASGGAATFAASVGTTALNMNNMASLGSIGGGAIYLPYTAGLFFRTANGATARGKIQADDSNNLLLNSDNGGNVAIGNTSPLTKLHVTGTVSAVEVILSGGGSWSYTTSSSWTSYQVGIPYNSLAGGGVYLIRLQWGGDAPYIAYGSCLWMPVQSNGGGSDNEMAVMVSTHQGGGGLIFVRNGSVSGQASSQLLIRLANFAQYVGNLTITAARLM